MMRRWTLLAALAVAVAACGSEEEDHQQHEGGETPDAPAGAQPDGGALQSGPVVAVDCAGATIAVEVTTPGFRYEPAQSTITAGQIVRFDPAAGHDVASDTGAFSVPFGGASCFRFDAPGTFKFHCTPHDFKGTIVVQ
jgi:plastocyanin